jgi:hypothetical protein
MWVIWFSVMGAVEVAGAFVLRRAAGNAPTGSPAGGLRTSPPTPGRWLMKSNLAMWKAATAAAAMIMLLLVVTACGPTVIKSGSSARSPSAAAAPGTFSTDSAVCRDVAALHASVDKLLSYRPGKNTIASLKANLSEVNTKLVALQQSAHGTLSAQRGPLQAALRNLQDEVTAAVGTGQVTRILRALDNVRAKAQDLFTAAKAECP